MTEKPYWEIVVLTSKDRQQQEIYKNQIAAKKLRNAILSSIEFEVYADPEEFPIGTGGSSIHCLNRLFEKYGENIFSKRILVVHAGGFSKRLPNHSIFGKIFSPVSVHGHNIRDLLDLKIEFTQRFCPFMVNGGVFFAASDDVETFTLEGLKVKDFRNFEGVVALAHPSSLEIGKNHGVYVLSLPTPGSSLAWFDDDCTEVLQKPSVSAMRSHGCTFTNNGAECVYSDSCFWITPSVAHKLLELERHFDIYKKETCIYGALTEGRQARGLLTTIKGLQISILKYIKDIRCLPSALSPM
ncbi:fucose-1-phosphate guanylyltransferase-like isoform X2 [Artemia franciscana]|uniref:fucose-1-phosphate guanylyltransferase-like isoform X2 n=1 Tax=Artemia franciscana TaxID=6661 RepID=UPI0032DBBAA7